MNFGPSVCTVNNADAAIVVEVLLLFYCTQRFNLDSFLLHIMPAVDKVINSSCVKEIIHAHIFPSQVHSSSISITDGQSRIKN
jgi:hypothetical protein